jgi:hypothetical protein
LVALIKSDKKREVELGCRKLTSREDSGPPASSVAEKGAAGFLSINPSFSADLNMFLQRNRTLFATVGYPSARTLSRISSISKGDILRYVYKWYWNI